MKRINELWMYNELKGGIHQMNSDGTYTAFTATTSKVYKTYKGAVKRMTSEGFVKA